MKGQKKRIYIAGKITGEDDIVYREKFARAKSFIESSGFHAVNPAHLDNAFTFDMTHDDWMMICFAAMRICDAVFALSDYRDSEGATKEVQYAKDIGIPVIGFYNDEDI